ncbi:MAG: hypothetical protein RLZZ245_3281 [Verrucomicrobiota bacterium]
MLKPQPFILESLVQGFTSYEPTSCATKTTTVPKPAAAVIARHGLRRPSLSLKPFYPYKAPPNYQLVADELDRLCDFKRARSNVEAYVQEHLAHLVPARPRKNRPYRRFRRAHIGELWQHDSSIHQWWAASTKQTLLLTVDDHSGLNLAGTFVTSDTT